MKKRRIIPKKRNVWTKDGKSQIQLTLFHPQIKEKEIPDPKGFIAKKRKPRKKFLIDNHIRV